MIRERINEDRASLLVWEVTETRDELLREINHPDSLEEYQKLNTEKRKKEFLAVRVALKYLFEEEIYISYDENGKPFLSGKRYNVSISHSGNWVAVLTHPEREVGVDIECIGNRVEKVYSRFLSEKERLYLSEKKKKEQLHIMWSAKEAAYKIFGKETVDFANQLYIEPFDMNMNRNTITIHTMSGKKLMLQSQLTSQYTLVYGMY